ncbi:MAG: hypothetical protein WCC60_01130 [Ilumatobacteraceae bacterium]
MKRSRPLPSTTLPAWLARIGAEAGQPDRRLAEAAADLVETMSERPAGTIGALHRFGNTLGADGWPIAQISHWLQWLGQFVDRSRRKQLAHYSSHAAVAQGWAEGYVRGAHTGMCIDPTTGLVTSMVLRLRLEEVYDHSAAAGVRPSDLYTLLLIDVDLAGLVRLDADLLMACVADTVHTVFHQGETIARAGDRILVLASNVEATMQRGEILADRLRLAASTSRAHATVLMDQLPDSPSMIERYLGDLMGTRSGWAT